MPNTIIGMNIPIDIQYRVRYSTFQERQGLSLSVIGKKSVFAICNAIEFFGGRARVGIQMNERRNP
jgi:hypothetical protein